MAMKLEYEQVEELFDDTTRLRTISEQVIIPGKGILLRTTVYSAHHVAVNVLLIDGLGHGFEPVKS
jgi:hypothetical protein